MRENASAKKTLMETAVRSAKRASTITPSVKVISRMTLIAAAIVVKMTGWYLILLPCVWGLPFHNLCRNANCLDCNFS
jgi:hypothetical protein